MNLFKKELFQILLPEGIGPHPWFKGDVTKRRFKNLVAAIYVAKDYDTSLEIKIVSSQDQILQWSSIQDQDQELGPYAY